MNADLTIGELARRAGVNVQTLRYYERRGLLPRPLRTAAGHRRFPASTLGRIRSIRRAQELGFTLAEVEVLLDKRADHPRIHALARARLQQLERDLQHLFRSKEDLQDWLAACDRAASAVSCAVVRSLAEGEIP